MEGDQTQGTQAVERGADDVQSMLDRLQQLSLALRERHGVACAILGKDGRVVAFVGGDQCEGGGATATSSPLPTASHPGYDGAGVILKVNSDPIKYLYASSDALVRHSPYFEALFKHPCIETRDRTVELNLPCVEMLEATLVHLYTGQAPEPLPDGGRYSLSPDHFFGLLANAKLLLLDALTEQCGDFFARLVEQGDHEDFIGHPGFGPELFPASCILTMFQVIDPRGYCTDDLRERLLASAFAWLEGMDEDTVRQILPAEDLRNIISKVERSAIGLPFSKLETLHKKSSQGFRRLVSLAAFFPKIRELESDRNFYRDLSDR